MFRIISDLHLEGMDKYSLPKTKNEKETVLFLAGDICEFHMITYHEPYQKFLTDCNKRFKLTIYVPGNHEYYGSSIVDFRKYKTLIEKKYKNVKVVDREIITVPITVKGKETNFKVVCATLWTDMNRKDPITKVRGQTYLKDFNMIKEFTPELFIEENEKARTFIRYAVMDSEERSDPTIVITHYGPTYKSVSPTYQNLGYQTNGLFVNNDLDLLFEALPLRLWVHGHTHESVNHLLGHGCRVIANPKGWTSLISLGGKVLSNHQNSNYDELFTLSPEDLYF